jgi:hypothetical protein
MKPIRFFISQSLIGLALLSAAAFSQAAIAETITGQSGNVRAEISYDKPQEYQYKNVRVNYSAVRRTELPNSSGIASRTP